MKRLTHKQIQALAKGANPEAVIAGTFDWAELVRTLAKEITRQKALRFAEDE